MDDIKDIESHIIVDFDL